MKRCKGFVPGTGFHASPAPGTFLVPHAHGGTFLHVDRPLLITVVHLFGTIGNGTGGTLTSTFFTLVAKILHSEINWFIGCEGQICGDDGSLEPRTEEGVDHDITDAGHLS